MTNTVNAYPFWNPQGAGAAENFALPQEPSSEQIKASIDDSVHLKVPQETEYDQRYGSVWQYIPAFVPVPQGPAHVSDPFTQSRSLLDYARSTLGTSQYGVEDKRGQEGQTGKLGK